MRTKRSTFRRVSCAFAVPLLSLLPAADALAVQGQIVTPVTFSGPVTGRSISFSLYLPPGYDTGTTRYPVVYHLHGIGGAHNNPNQLNVVSQSHEDAVAAGRIGPVLIVFPDAATDSFWADSIDGVKRIETHVVQEILTYVDATYRTQPTRTRRAAQGFSMGGFGAAKLASKFPELFCASVIYDGALVTWPRMQQFHAGLATSLFGNDEAYFNQYSPWYWVPQHAATLETSVPFRQVVGSLVDANQEFHARLLSHRLRSEYLETGCAHTLNCVLNAGGADSWSFIAAAFGNATPSPTPTPTPPTTSQSTFLSIGAEDGWMLESTETSGAGGTEQSGWAGASALIAGDDARDRQYKAIVSFDTSSLPENATVVSAMLRLKRGTVSGTSPFTTHGAAAVDIRAGGFGDDTTLAASDFAAPATAAQVGTLSHATANGSWSEAALNAAGRSAIHKAGPTQLRVAFPVGDDDDATGDSMTWYSGENATSANRPQLVVTYR